MISFTARSARTTFSGPTKELKKMYPCLRTKDKRAYWRARYALQRVGYRVSSKVREKIIESSKWIKFYDSRNDTFATGLLPRVLRRLEKKGIKYHVRDKRKPFPEFDLTFKRLRFRAEARDEQLGAVRTSLQHGRGILHCATNFGKTEVACGIIAEWAHQQKRIPKVLFLIHRASLVQQTVKRFQQHLVGVKVSMVGAGEKRIPRSGIIVATVQTASRILRELEEFQEKCDILFIDEFHINKASAIESIVIRNEAPMRFGLSGTIDKKNKTKMMRYVGMIGPIIFEVRNKELVEKGRSAKPYAVFREVDSEYIPKQIGFNQSYKEGVIYNKVRNRMIFEDTVNHIQHNRRTLITIWRRAHGHELKRMFERELDLRVEYLDGNSPLDIRQKVIKDFEQGKVGVLIGSQIFDVGMDIPAITGWVNAGGGKGWELVLQRLGRTLRKKKTGKNVIHISDYVDLHSKYLMDHSLRRINHYRKEEIVDIEIVEVKRK